MTTWKNWDPEGLKTEIKRKMADNAQIVGKFVEEDARRRLMGIEDPEWGKAYRQKLVARLLTNIVEEKANEIVIIVGVRTSKSGRYHGFYIELGSKTAPAHPFLRPAVFENAKKIVALLAGG